MRNHAGRPLNAWKRFFFTVGISALALRIIAGLLSATYLRAQSLSDSTARPRFDVASIKVNKNLGSGKLNLTQAGGHLTASNVSVKFLIIQAYQIERVHFAPNPAGADWMDSEHFDIEAVAEGNPAVEQKRLMIQSLLSDRFKLTMHHEARQLPEYALVILKAGKIGPQLQLHSDSAKCVNVSAGQPNPAIVPGTAALPPCGGLRMANGNLVGQNVTMEKLAATLSVLVNRNVADRTGLNGTFDMTLRFQIVPLNPDTSESDPSGPPSIFTALQEQLGLKLKSQTGPVDVIVIDHMERPAEN